MALSPLDVLAAIVVFEVKGAITARRCHHAIKPIDAADVALVVSELWNVRCKHKHDAHRAHLTQPEGCEH